MEQRLKETFDKITLDDGRKQDIRNTLIENPKKRYRWIKYVACAAICIAVLFSIPYTRTAIVHAATYITSIFHGANGTEVSYESTDNEVRFTVSSTGEDYTKVEDGRLYLVVGDDCVDVTDLCDDDSYFRYEVANEDGGKSVIFVGGTVEAHGWVELIFDADGNYVFNQMQVGTDSSGETPAWAKEAMHNEGVPCGDPVLDEQLDE